MGKIRKFSATNLTAMINLEITLLQLNEENMWKILMALLYKDHL